MINAIKNIKQCLSESFAAVQQHDGDPSYKVQSFQSFRGLIVSLINVPPGCLGCLLQAYCHYFPKQCDEADCLEHL